MLLPAEHELLLRIIEAPEDVELRFVLADLLNARGEPLGELITVQCALESIRSGARTGDYGALKARERELLALHRPRWHQQAAPFARELEFRRGLPEVLHANALTLVQDGGLTVLAPIRELKLDRVRGVSLTKLLHLPLLSRVRALALDDFGGPPLGHTPGLPLNVRRLRLSQSRFDVLQVLATDGWLQSLEWLEVSVTRLDTRRLGSLDAPGLKVLSLVGGTNAPDREWLVPALGLLERHEGLKLQWRGEQYDRAGLQALLDAERPTQRIEIIGVERERLGDVSNGTPIARALPHGVTLSRLPDGALVARCATDAFEWDARVQLSLPPHPTRLTAVARRTGVLRYERWPARSLEEVGLPLPVEKALQVAAAVAQALASLEQELERRGVPSGPLSRDDVFLGDDGAVKLLPGFFTVLFSEEPGYSGDEERRPLGVAVDVTSPLVFCATVLLHLLTGQPPVRLPPSRHWTSAEVVDIARELEELRDRPLLPSMLNAEWKPLDAFVERCLTRDRARQVATREDFAAESLALLKRLGHS